MRNIVAVEIISIVALLFVWSPMSNLPHSIEIPLVMVLLLCIFLVFPAILLLLYRDRYHPKLFVPRRKLSKKQFIILITAACISSASSWLFKDTLISVGVTVAYLVIAYYFFYKSSKKKQSK